MKKVIASIILNVLATGLFAHGMSSLLVKSIGYQNFTVMLDNHRFHSNTNTLKIENLKPGNHHLKIIVNNSSQHGKYWSSEEVYNGHFISKPGTRVIAKIALNNFTELRHVAKQKHTYSGVRHSNYPICEKNTVINEAWFNELKSVIDNTPFDATKLSMAKQALYTNSMNAYQVKELMELFSFEKTKLDLAKYAYHKVVDVENYYLVNQAFDFNSSADKLNNYLAVL